jgi:hypothetical protein
MIPFLKNELSPAASCGVSDRYDIANLIEASFGELDPKRLKPPNYEDDRNHFETRTIQIVICGFCLKFKF